MRNVLILGLAASTRKGVVLATLWPSLFGVVLRWQVTRKPFFRTSALHVYLKAVNDIGFNASNAGGPALPHAAQAFRSFLEILMWAKVLKVAAEQGVVDKAYKKLDLDEFYGVTLAHPDTPLIRQFWLTALSSNEHAFQNDTRMPTRARVFMLLSSASDSNHACSVVGSCFM